MLLSTNLAQGTTIDDSTKQKVLADTSAAPQGLSGQKDIIPLVLSIKWDLTNLANSYISVYLFQIFKIDNLSLEGSASRTLCGLARWSLRVISVE